jgi:hypothetical protein
MYIKAMLNLFTHHHQQHVMLMTLNLRQGQTAKTRYPERQRKCNSRNHPFIPLFLITIRQSL